MTDVTTILSQIEHGDPAAAEQLLPLVYEELRNLAAAKLASEKPGQTLQATALVHEAYLRLVDQTTPQQWDGKGKWSMASKWFTPMRDVVRPMIEKAAAAYAKENKITPRSCK